MNTLFVPPSVKDLAPPQHL